MPGSSGAKERLGRVLVIDDHDDLRALLRAVLERAGHEVSTAADGREALRAFFERRPDVVLLDIDLPAPNGWTILSRIRELSDVPVLLLTGQDGDLEKLRAFSLGADDYVTKPFSAGEVAARVGALMKRLRHVDAPDVDDDGLIRMDHARRVVEVAGVPTHLTPLEFRLLATLVRHRGVVLSRDQLLELVWDDTSGVGSGDEVRVYVGYLRRKLARVLDGSPIATVRGFGYRYEPADAIVPVAAVA
jgi:DNA-binding response OmpR family regulator